MMIICGICGKPLILSEYGANHYYCSRCNVSVKVDVEGKCQNLNVISVKK